jgi:serine/threonine-protein kinase
MVPAAAKQTKAREGFRAGDVIAGKYRLDWETREGGMCRVWMGVNTALDLPVAIKFLRTELRCPRLARCLQREARAMAALQHPAIVRIFDSGEITPDNPYIVMERLEGEELRQSLSRERRLPAEEAVRLLLPIASALEAAHWQGIVHRDLKPENILLARDDAGRIHPKLLDFGIAKFKSEEELAGSSDDHAIGTLGYMPLEQALALDGLDHRADVWAFCAVLYEAISGRTPLSGKTFDDMHRALVQDVIPCLVDQMGMDASLWAILERGLRNNPENRWSSMRELGATLAEWLTWRGIRDDVCGASLSTEWLHGARRHTIATYTGPTDISERPPEEHGLRSPTQPFPLLRNKKTALDGVDAVRDCARRHQGPQTLGVPPPPQV